ncbi:hypothetical protein DRO66_02430 [Candidatus Bathyarchaeota archaeon]|nr:MAG: hypothetical protein DRO66_02430 [Candidatus Bathyarchaeota archaeon]
MKLTLKGFEAHQHTEFDLSQGLVFLVGANSMGKSSVRKAIEGLIDNELEDDRIKDGEDVLDVTLELGGDVIQWVRRRKGSPKMSYFINGKKTNPGRGLCPELTKFGLNRIETSTDRVLLNVCREWGAPFMLGATGPQKFELLSKVMSERGLLDVTKDIASDRKSSNKQIIGTESVLKELGEQLEAKSAEVEKYRPLDSVEITPESLQADVQLLMTLVNTAVELHDLNEELLPLDGLLTRLREGLDAFSAIKAKANLNVTIHSIKEAISIQEEDRRISKEEEDINSKESILKETLNKLNCLDNVKENMDTILSLEQLRTEAVTVEEQMTKLLKAEVACQSTIDAFKGIDTFEEQMGAIQATKAELKALEAIKWDADALVSTERSLEDGIETCKRELESVEAELAEFKVCPLCGK